LLAHQYEVLRVIARVEFKLKYADSALGYLWSVAKPMALFAVLYIVFGRFFGLGSGIQHYRTYLLVGVVLWTFFIDATSLTLYSIVGRGSLLRKLSFPRIVIPISVTLTSAITFCINITVIAIFVAYDRLVPNVRWLLLVPLLVELYVVVLGTGLVLTTLYVRFRDVGQIWELSATLLFYASPIIIPVAFLPPWYQPFAFLFPFVQVMQDVRATLISESPVTTATNVLPGGPLVAHVIPIAIALGVLVVGVVMFQRESPRFAERV
jgi:ABC-2 type transport system permease protein